MQTITITLDLGEIIYDIQNKTYLTGKSRKDGKNHEMVANMQANDDEENANQVLRSIAMAYGNLKTRLAEYLDQEFTAAENTLPTLETPLNLALEMPSNFNLSTIDTLAAAAHQYIVCMAVKDWFTITHKVDASDYGALGEASLAILAEALNKRRRPIRRRKGGEQ